MRILTAIMTAFFSLWLTGFMTARPDEPKTEPAPAAAPAAKAPESGVVTAVDKHSEENLRSRVDQFWKSKIATKYEECYNLLTKKSREKQTLVNYIQRINTRTTSYQIESITPDPASSDHMKVLLFCRLQALGYKMDHARQSQDWYFEDGDWFVEYIAKTPFDSKSRKAATEKTDDAAKAVTEGAEGKAEKSSLDPGQKKHIQELLDQLRKSRGSTKPSLNEAMAPPQPAAKPEAQKPASTPDQTSAEAGPAAPAGDAAKPSAEKKATNYQTKPKHHSSRAAKSADAPKEQETAKTGGPTEETAKQESAKAGTTPGTAAKEDPAKTGKPAETPAKKDPAKTGGDPK